METAKQMSEQAPDNIPDELRNEAFVPQVADRSLPAREVLAQQLDDRTPEDELTLFVP